MITVIPANGVVFILVALPHFQVARYLGTGHYRFEVQLAENWEELKAAARAELEAQVGAITEDGHYPCSEPLAEQAIFE